MQKSIHIPILSKAKSKLFRQLQGKKHRNNAGSFVISGEKIIAEAAAQKQESLEWVVAPEQWWQSNEELITLLGPDRTFSAPAEDIQLWSGFQTYWGPLALMNMWESDPLDQSVFLFLDELKDPGNLGTIVRIADWFGLREIYTDKGTADFYNPKTLSASMGSFLRVGMRNTTLQDLVEKHKELPVYMADMEGESTHTYDFQKPCLLIIGSESHGLSDMAKSIAGAIPITIPKFGNAESLNAGISTGIILDSLMRP